METSCLQYLSRTTTGSRNSRRFDTTPLTEAVTSGVALAWVSHMNTTFRSAEVSRNVLYLDLSCNEGQTFYVKWHQHAVKALDAL